MGVAGVARVFSFIVPTVNLSVHPELIEGPSVHGSTILRTIERTCPETSESEKALLRQLCHASMFASGEAFTE